MRKHLISILLLIISLDSCNSASELKEEHIVGNYYVGWNDLESNRNIYIKKTPESNSGQVVVSNYVFAVGNNDRYIIAKSSSGPNSSATKYHLIDSKGEYHTNLDNNNYWNYKSESEFNEKLVEIGLSNLEYDKIYRENPW